MFKLSGLSISTLSRAVISGKNMMAEVREAPSLSIVGKRKRLNLLLLLFLVSDL